MSPRDSFYPGFTKRCQLSMELYSKYKISRSINNKVIGYKHTLRPRQNYRHFADDVFKFILLNGNIWMSLMNSLKSVPKVWNNDIPWASYQIRKIAGCAWAGNAGNVFPRRRFQRKPLVSDPGMHHGPCVTHVPWCMSGSLTGGDGENVPGIPGACAPAILRIWQEAHG